MRCSQALVKLYCFCAGQPDFQANGANTASHMPIALSSAEYAAATRLKVYLAKIVCIKYGCRKGALRCAGNAYLKTGMKCSFL